MRRFSGQLRAIGGHEPEFGPVPRGCNRAYFGGRRLADPQLVAFFTTHRGARASTGKFIEVAGAKLHYVERGTGPPIVIIHGLAGQMRNFTYALFDRLAKDHRVILLDRPGAGYSRSPDGQPLTIIGQAEIVAHFMSALAPGRPLLVGHSLGGAVGLALALTRPDLLCGLALVAPLTRPRPMLPPMLHWMLRIAPGWVRAVVAHSVAIPIGRLLAHKIRLKLFAPEPVVDDFSLGAGGALVLRPSSLMALFHEVATVDRDLAAMAPRYSDCDLPVAILFGKQDEILDFREQGQLTAPISLHAVIELVDGGHMLPLSAPDMTAAVRSPHVRTDSRERPIGEIPAAFMAALI